MKKTVGAKRLVVALMISCLLIPQSLLAAKAVDESPNEWAMVGDLLVARPVGLVMTVGGAAVWLVILAALKRLAKSASSCPLKGSPEICRKTPAGIALSAFLRAAASSLKLVVIASLDV